MILAINDGSLFRHSVCMSVEDFDLCLLATQTMERTHGGTSAARIPDLVGVCLGLLALSPLGDVLGRVGCGQTNERKTYWYNVADVRI